MISNYNICGRLEQGINVLERSICDSMHSVNKIHTKIKSVDIKPYRASKPYTYPEKEGEIFTGWYIDKDYEEPITNEYVTEGKFYPMYADSKALEPIARLRISGALYQYMVIVGQPCHNVLERGFYINGERRIVSSASTQINVFGEIIHNYDFGEGAIYLFAISLLYGKQLGFRAIPFYVTLDGTEVKGTEIIVAGGE